MGGEERRRRNIIYENKEQHNRSGYKESCKYLLYIIPSTERETNV